MSGLAAGTSHAASSCVTKPLLPRARAACLTLPNAKRAVRAHAAASSPADNFGDSRTGISPYELSDELRRSLLNSAQALKRWGWISFWIQLALSLTSFGILLFSVAFTTTQGPRISLYMTLFAIILSIFSTFWTFGYTRLSRKVTRYANTPEGHDAEAQRKQIKKRDVKKTLRNGLTINVLGMGAALLGLQAMVGMLVAKTLSSASVNPFFGGAGQSQLNPVVALDVFLVQAATNTLLSHFASLVLCFLLLRSVDQ